MGARKSHILRYLLVLKIDGWPGGGKLGGLVVDGGSAGPGDRNDVRPAYHESGVREWVCKIPVSGGIDRVSG
jgi:hypothetical protein